MGIAIGIAIRIAIGSTIRFYMISYRSFYGIFVIRCSRSLYEFLQDVYSIRHDSDRMHHRHDHGYRA